MDNTSFRKLGALFLTGIMSAALTLILSSYTAMRCSANHTPPSPKMSTAESVLTLPKRSASTSFPTIDWEYWQSINPDIVGWISIPNTPINSPIVQAHPDRPLHYLNHDIYGNYNIFGAIYIDADCAANGLDSLNSILAGHHIGKDGNAMFGKINNYLDGDYASSHTKIFLQTPLWEKEIKPGFVCLSSDSEASLQSSFTCIEEYEDWFAERLASSKIQFRQAESPPPMLYTLYTCTQGSSNSSRTVLYAWE